MIDDLILKDKRIFLRADLNVPLDGTNILIDHKLKAILPTIDYIKQQGGKIILATHIGRPKGFDESLSTKILLPWFKKQGYQIQYSPNLNNVQANVETITLLENLRFYNGEQGKDPNFAKELASLADAYINDAFGCIHRDDTSLYLLPLQFKKDNRNYGLLIETELTNLEKIKKNAKQPFILILGGNKTLDKIPMIKNFLITHKENKPKAIIIGGAMAYTFLKAQGSEVGNSLVEKEAIPDAQYILQEAKNQGIKILLPTDSIIEISANQFVRLPHNQFPKNGMGVDIGQNSIDHFTRKIEDAHTVFINGTMGIYTNPNYEFGTKAILDAICKSHAFSVAGGGDATAAVYKFHLNEKFNFISTGGGATLKYLSLPTGKEIEYLPTLKILFT